MRSLVVVVGLAMSLWSASVSATELEDFEKAVGKFLSDPAKPPKKGLCACLADSVPFALKRAGFLHPGSVAGTPAVSCMIPIFDEAGARTDLVPCSDWELLSK